jgi:hypothetical protein
MSYLRSVAGRHATCFGRTANRTRSTFRLSDAGPNCPLAGGSSQYRKSPPSPGLPTRDH